MLCSPGCHFFTNRDYTDSFNRKGKVRPLKLLEKFPEASFQDVLFELSDTEDKAICFRIFSSPFSVLSLFFNFLVKTLFMEKLH